MKRTLVPLGTVCSINPKGERFDDDFEVSFIPMQNVGETGTIDTSTVKPYSEVKKGYTGFIEGDVLFAKITPCMENGKGAIASGLYNGVGYGSTEFHVLRPSESITAKWLYYLTSWDVFRKECEKNMTGSAGQKRVPAKYLESYRVHIPNLSEQERITTILDLICEQIKLHEEMLAEFDCLVKSRFIEMFGDPVRNDKGWPLAPLASLAEIKIGPFGSLLHKEDYVHGGHALVNPSHIIDGHIVTDDDLTVSETKYAEMEAYHLRTGDIVLGRRGEMGRCAVVYNDGLLCGTGSLIIRPSAEMLPYFLQKIISYPTYKESIEDMAVGVTMMNLNVPIVSNFMIPVLPLEEQSAYLRFVEQTDKSKFSLKKGGKEVLFAVKYIWESLCRGKLP